MAAPQRERAGNDQAVQQRSTEQTIENGTEHKQESAAAQFRPSLAGAGRVPTRLPGRDADGERVRTRYVHPGRHAASQPEAQADGRAASTAAQPEGQAPAAELEVVLAEKIGRHAFERYFRGQAKLERRGEGLLVVVASRFLVAILENRFRMALVELAGGGPVDFIDRPADFPKVKAKAVKIERAKPQERAPRPHAPQRDRAVRLDDFVIGPSNELAFMAARTLSDPSTPPSSGTLLVLHGGCGLGKTHLLRGMAAQYNEQRGSQGKARYVTAEQFTNGFLSALRSGQTERFREQYRGVELLCLDDVHFLATKEATKAELLHTLDQILQAGCRLALASDEHPRQVEGLGKQLISRLLSGLTIELAPPDPALREAMVRRLATRRGLIMDDSVVAAIARSAGEAGDDSESVGSFRDIEGAMARVDAFHNLMSRVGGQAEGGQVTLATVQQALGRRASAPQLGPMRVESVIEGVCRYLGVGHTEFAGRGRHRRVVLARALVALISRQLTTSSYPEIASAMGRPNHSSIITAVRRIERQIADEEKVAVGCEADGLTVGELAAHLTQRLRARSR